MVSPVKFIAGAATALHFVFGEDESNYSPDSLPNGVLHFPLSRRTLKERVDIVRRDTESVGVQLDNNVSSFTSYLSVGSDNQNVTVIVDTGSSDLWMMSSHNPYCSSLTSSDSVSKRAQVLAASNGEKIKCQKDTVFDYTKSSSFTVNNTRFEITYGDGTFANGSYCQDTISYGSAKIKDANFALANSTDSAQSVWGIGLTGLESTVKTYDESGNFSPTYSNLPAQMKEQGIIGSVAYSLWLNNLDASSGSLLFGGVDHTKYNGTLQTVPLLSTYSGAKPNEFQIKLDKITLYQGSNSADVVTCEAPALLDSGTTYMMLPGAFLSAIAGSVGGRCTTKSCTAPCGLDGGLTFDFSGIQISVPFSEFLFQTSSASSTCIMGMLESDSIILGDTFLRSAYVVYDLENYEIGLAPANYDASSSSIEAITNGIPSATKASGYSSTSLASTYNTNYATFFTTAKDQTISATGSSGGGGSSPSSGTTHHGGGPGPFGSLIGSFTSLALSEFSEFTGAGGTASASDSSSSSGNKKSSNGGSSGSRTMPISEIFGSMFISALGLLL